jgi:hypothetical protein
MVASWRAYWGGASFPWLTTQLGDQGFSPDDGGKAFSWPSYVEAPRDAQQAILPGRYPGVSRTAGGGLISSYDRGDRVANPFGVWDVHSRFKGELGRRMALVFENATGLRSNATSGVPVDWDGPLPVSASQLANGSVALKWVSIATGASVYANGTQDCWECCDGSHALDTFQLSPTLAGPNGTNAGRQAWTNASWTYDAASGVVTLSPMQPPAPGKPWLVVRYAASLWPQCAWYSASNDVPARSFSDLNVSASSQGKQ